MITINSNSSALMAQNNLYTNQANLQSNMQQLSTGLRINSASDDAAGLQISNRMQTQMNGLDQAQRNANDAISMAQTAEGAMTENTTILNRMRDLSLQAANDTNTLEDRQAMQKEVDALISEVDRIAETTNFAGINLLDGSAEQMSFQIGSNPNETIEFGIKAMNAESLGAGEIEVDRADITSIFTFDDEGVLEGDTVIKLQDTTGEQATVELTLSEGMSQEEVLDALNQQGGLNAEIVDDRMILSGTSLAGFNYITASVEGEPTRGAEVKTETVNASVADIDLTTAAGAQIALDILDSALAEVDEQRADLGAVQNRLESTISNLSNIEENLGVSQSRILDADFAKQTVEMTSNQMLMQAGTSVLAQAKTMPQYATMLL